jgi:D-alanyl-D-alanine carboxypeptidase
LLRFGAPLLARFLVIATTMGVAAAVGASRAGADALLLIEADSGRVLHAENATYPWYPASITKIMTAYVTLRAVREGRLRLDTLLTVSENALAQQPSKMGFPVGTQITVDDAVKMLMVKSANDVAVVLAEGVSGSVEKFADEMNRAGARIGMTQSSWVNPNGLPAENQITSARDMAILARAVIREFPEHELYWRIPAIKFGRQVLRNYNKLIDRYPGADGMKTGFICASGFNLVATASRNGRRLIAVVLGAPSATERAEKTARLLERGFGAGIGLSWLMPSLASVDALQPIAAAPPNLRDEVCGKNRRRVRTDHGEEEENQPAGAQPESGSAAYAMTLPSFRTASGNGSLLTVLPPSMPPIKVSAIPPKGVSAATLEAPARAKLKRGERKSAVIAVPKPENPTAAPNPGAAPAPKAAAPAGKPRPAAKPKPAAASGTAAVSEPKVAKSKPAAPSGATIIAPAAKPKPAAASSTAAASEPKAAKPKPAAASSTTIMAPEPKPAAAKPKPAAVVAKKPAAAGAAKPAAKPNP